jgi:hypothetical protein
MTNVYTSYNFLPARLLKMVLIISVLRSGATVAQQMDTRARRGSLLIRQPDFVVQSGGHMRSFSGIAYIPQLLPKYVTVDEIQ